MASLVERDRAALWHPYTQHHTAAPPLGISRAAGAYVYDETGRPLLDLISSWWTCLHGHCQPALVAALAQQAGTLDHVLFAGHTHAPAVDLAELLLQKAPEFAKVFYSDNGSTAVEAGLKMALHYWRNKQQPQRCRLVALEHGYHGDTFGAMALGRSSGYFEAFAPYLPAADYVPASLEAITAYVAEHGETIAAFLFEPLVQGAGGMRMHDAADVSRWCGAMRGCGALLIADEVMTGFGRTGTLFAYQQLGLAPDIVCLSKGISGGMLPLAATLVTQDIYAAFLGNSFSTALAHGHSYTGNPIACAVALASLRLFETGAPQQSMTRINAAHKQYIPELVRAVPELSAPRVCGTIAAVDLPKRFAYGSAQSMAVRDAFYAAGLLLRPMGQTLYLMPPYCITAEELKQAYATMERVLQQVLKG